MAGGFEVFNGRIYKKCLEFTVDRVVVSKSVDFVGQARLGTDFNPY
jgi:hypothetical protein